MRLLSKIKHRNDPTVSVTRDEVGNDWPLTVDHGTVRFEPPGHVVFIAPDGTEYAVNGFAKTKGYEDIAPIWRDDPDPCWDFLDADERPKLSIDPILSVGLALER